MKILIGRSEVERWAWCLTIMWGKKTVNDSFTSYERWICFTLKVRAK